MTPEQDAILRDIQGQLRGPAPSGWPPGAPDDRSHTLAEALELALHQIAELRTEISDLEATTAELSKQVQYLSDHQWPWPLSLLTGPAAALVGDQLGRLEALLAELPLPGRGTATGNRNGVGDRVSGSDTRTEPERGDAEWR